MVLSSYLSTYVVDPVFAAPRQHSALEVLFAIYGYAVQIYADFSGYTDIAIGLALLLGFQFPQNFDAPTPPSTCRTSGGGGTSPCRSGCATTSTSRWAATGAGGRVSTNIMVTMLLGGLWHGAAWTFVAWGAYHGSARWSAGSAAAPAARACPRSPPAGAGWPGPLRHLPGRLPRLGLLPGRHPRDRLAMLGRLFFGWGPSPLVTPLAVLAIAAGIASQYLPDDWLQRVQGLRRPPAAAPGGHTGPGAPGHHHPGPAGRRPLHLLPLLSVAATPPSPRTRRSRAPAQDRGAVNTLEDGTGESAGNEGVGPTAGSPNGPVVATEQGPVAGAEPEPSPRPRFSLMAAPPGGIPWTRMLFIGVVCFGVWLLLDAPSLQRSATVSPLGTRRTVSLDVVGPIAAISRGLGLSHLVSWSDEALGRSPGGGPTLAKRLHPPPPTRRGDTGPSLRGRPAPPDRPTLCPRSTCTRPPPIPSGCW